MWEECFVVEIERASCWLSFWTQNMITRRRPWPSCVSELAGSSLFWLSPVGLALPVAMPLGACLPWQLCSSRWCQLASSTSCLHRHLITWSSSFASMCTFCPLVSSPPSSCLQICEQPVPWHACLASQSWPQLSLLQYPQMVIFGDNMTYLQLTVRQRRWSGEWR